MSPFVIADNGEIFGKIGDDAIPYTEVAAERIDKYEWYAADQGIGELPFEPVMDDQGIDSGKTCN